MEVLTEDEIIDSLIIWFKAKGWEIENYCKGQEKGIDILAVKDGNKYIVEAKGARGNNKIASTVRSRFDSGQLHTHLGVAILKVLKERLRNPGAKIAIAHPDDEYIRKTLSELLTEIKRLDIIILWVHRDGSVEEG